jgi:hypothetical protein
MNSETKTKAPELEAAAFVQLVNAVMSCDGLSETDKVNRLRHLSATLIKATESVEVLVHGTTWVGGEEVPGNRTVELFVLESFGTPAQASGDGEPSEWCVSCAGFYPNGGCVCPRTIWPETTKAFDALSREQQEALKKGAKERGTLTAGDPSGYCGSRVHARTLKALVKKGLAEITREQELRNRRGEGTGKIGYYARLTEEGRRLAGMEEGA